MSIALSGRRTACLLSLLSLAFGSYASAPGNIIEVSIEASAFVADATREEIPPVDIRRGHLLELQAAVFGDRGAPSLRPVDNAAAFAAALSSAGQGAGASPHA